MPTVEEKTAFAERLKFAMKRAPEKLRGGTDLALHFNLRHRGEHPVSPQTAHKWLSGRTIPTDDKLATLAEWFGVDKHWLHYGPSPSGVSPAVPRLAVPRAALPKSAVPKAVRRDEKYPPSPEVLELASKIEALTPHHRYLLEELVAQFYGDASSV